MSNIPLRQEARGVSVLASPHPVQSLSAWAEELAAAGDEVSLFAASIIGDLGVAGLT